VIPDKEKALELHAKYGSDERIVKHGETVAEVARILIEKLMEKNVVIDEKITIAAALLHDIGRTKIQTVHHGYIGARILESEGVDMRIAEIIRKHVGAGISKEEASILGLPGGNYMPKTLEEKIVCFSDKMVDGSNVRPFSEEVKRFERKRHDVKRLWKLKQDLQDVLGRDPEELILDNINM
jgi:uncharacterized protein (TIGR00295 family)